MRRPLRFIRYPIDPPVAKKKLEVSGAGVAMERLPEVTKPAFNDVPR